MHAYFSLKKKKKKRFIVYCEYEGQPYQKTLVMEDIFIFEKAYKKLFT